MKRFRTQKVHRSIGLKDYDGAIVVDMTDTSTLLHMRNSKSKTSFPCTLEADHLEGDTWSQSQWMLRRRDEDFPRMTRKKKHMKMFTKNSEEIHQRRAMTKFNHKHVFTKYELNMYVRDDLEIEPRRMLSHFPRIFKHKSIQESNTFQGENPNSRGEDDLEIEPIRMISHFPPRIFKHKSIQESNTLQRKKPNSRGEGRNAKFKNIKGRMSDRKVYKERNIFYRCTCLRKRPMYTFLTIDDYLKFYIGEKLKFPKKRNATKNPPTEKRNRSRQIKKPSNAERKPEPRHSKVCNTYEENFPSLYESLSKI